MTAVDAETVDAVTEIVNIGVGKAAGQLNQMTGSHIRLQIPSLSIVPFAKISSSETAIFSGDKLSAVLLNFRGSFSGISAVVFPPESASALVMLLTGEKEDSQDLDPMRIEALKEVGNIIINAMMGSIANVLSEHLEYSIPTYYEGSILETTAIKRKRTGDDWVLIARTNFLIESINIQGDILLLLEVGSLDRLVESIHKTRNR
ncbi:MAG TPA: chemotaxis protein CheX [Methanoregulaceae archaeon]|nr:chemotaxis protein CheX [Methanoregulaceae archaeon]